MKMFCASFLYLKFELLSFRKKEIGKKNAHQMLVKLASNPAGFLHVEQVFGDKADDQSLNIIWMLLQPHDAVATIQNYFHL